MHSLAKSRPGSHAKVVITAASSTINALQSGFFSKSIFSQACKAAVAEDGHSCAEVHSTSHSGLHQIGYSKTVKSVYHLHLKTLKTTTRANLLSSKYFYNTINRFFTRLGTQGQLGQGFEQPGPCHSRGLELDGI